MIADAAEREAALDLRHHVLAVAPAGSGKTGLLVRRALRALATVDEPEQVVCITFTNKAAAEIRERVIGALRLATADQPPPEPYLAALYADAGAALARDRDCGWNLIDNPARLQASTIDAFNQRLAGALPMLSGLGGRARIADAPALHYQAAVLDTFAAIDDRDTPPDLRDALLAVLDWASNRLDALLPELTELLARRDQWLTHRGQLLGGVEEDEAALRAAVVGELEAIRALLPDAECAQIVDALRDGSTQADELAWAAGLSAWPAAELDRLDDWGLLASTLLTNSGTLRKSADKRSGFIAKTDYKAAFLAAMSALHDHPQAADIEAGLALVGTLPDPQFPPEYATLRQHIGRVLEQCNLNLRLRFAQAGEVDHTEVALAAVHAASGDAGPEAIAKVDTELRHLLVDEMQDTSESQLRLLAELTQHWSGPSDESDSGDGVARSLFLVGDPQQSIYAFRKAEVRLFQTLILERKLVDLPLKIVAISTNFRSQSKLIDWFNGPLAAAFPSREDVYAGKVRYNRSAPAPDMPAGPGVRVIPVPELNRLAEGHCAAEAIADLAAADDSHIGLLGATRGHLAETMAALPDYGVASVQAVDVTPLGRSRAVSDFIQLVRALRHPEDRLAWPVLLRAPFVGLDWADLLALSAGAAALSWPMRLRRWHTGDVQRPLSDDGAQRLARLTKALRLAEPLRPDLPSCALALWHGLGGPACVAPDEHDAVLSAADCLRQQSRGGEIEDWPAFESALAALFKAPGAGRVEAMTVHKSKGLEFDHVVLTGCGRRGRDDARVMLHVLTLAGGVVIAPKTAEEADPGSHIYDFVHALNRSARRNERMRLLYVAATRAKRSLTVLVEAKADRKGVFKPQGNSFAELLWPALAPAFADVEPPPDDQDDAPELIAPALMPRVPADWTPPQHATPIWYPAEQRTLKPSEQALSGNDGDLDDGDPYAQLIGTMFHEALERIALANDAGQGPPWPDAAAQQRAMAAGLRRMGMAENRVDEAVARVTVLLDRTLAGDDGQWVLAGQSAARPWAASEFHLAGWVGGQWVSAIIDRCFEEADGTLWVVDYKTAAYPVDDPDVYADQAAERYAEQLAQYARLLREHRRPGAPEAAPVQTALLLAETGQLVKLDKC